VDQEPGQDRKGGEPREAPPPMSPGDEAERLAPPPPVRSSGPRGLLRHVVVDVGPLRHHRDFRLLWTGQTVSLLGSMFTYVAVPYQAYQLSRSSLVVGLLSAAELAPLLVMALLGGAFADAVDRRRLVLLAELLLAAASVALLVNALLPRPHLWVLFVVSALMLGRAVS
jgi:Na+/melibiose symporter-like transporter